MNRKLPKVAASPYPMRFSVLATEKEKKNFWHNENMMQKIKPNRHQQNNCESFFFVILFFKLQ